MIISYISGKRKSQIGSTQKIYENKRLIKPSLVVRVGPGANPKYGSHWTESLIAT